MAEAWWRMATGRYDVVHAVEEAAHLAAPLARLLRLPLVVDVDSSIPDQLRRVRLRRARPAAVGGGAPGEARPAARGGRDHRVRQPDGGGAGARAAGPRLPGGGPAARGRGRARRAGGRGPAPVARHRPGPRRALLRQPRALPGRRRCCWRRRRRCRRRGSSSWAASRPPIEALKARAGAGAARTVFAGQRPPAELPSFLALADVLVSPRLHGENTPFKVYTYLASGRPLVATRLPTHTQLLDDSIAFLVEPTATGLAGGIRAVLADPVEAAQRAARGRALIERDYSPRATPRRWLARTRRWRPRSSRIAADGALHAADA